MTTHFTRPFLVSGALVLLLGAVAAMPVRAAQDAPQDKAAPQNKPAMMMDHHNGGAMSGMSDMAGMSDMPRECQQMMMKMMMRMHQKMKSGEHDMSAMKDGKIMDDKAMNETHEKCMSAMKQMHEGDKGKGGTSQMPPRHTHKKNAH
jgi:hypothetical protein